MVREKQKHMDFVNQHYSQKLTQEQSETLKQVLTTLSQLHSVFVVSPSLLCSLSVTPFPHRLPEEITESNVACVKEVWMVRL